MEPKFKKSTTNYQNNDKKLNYMKKNTYPKEGTPHLIN